MNREALLRGKGMRLDFLLVSEALKSKLRVTGVDAEFNRREKPSDHAPAWIELAN